MHQVVELIKNSGDALVLAVISVSEEEANKLENTDTLQSQVPRDRVPIKRGVMIHCTVRYGTGG